MSKLFNAVEHRNFLLSLPSLSDEMKSFVKKAKFTGLVISTIEDDPFYVISHTKEGGVEVIKLLDNPDLAVAFYDLDIVQAIVDERNATGKPTQFVARYTRKVKGGISTVVFGVPKND